MLRTCATAVLAILLVAAPVRVVWVNLDRDGDGLSDCRERAGLRTVGGAATFASDAGSRDSDRDGVGDADEIGVRQHTSSIRGAGGLLFSCTEQRYAAISNPGLADSDYDGLGDALELSEGSDVFAQDSDGDGLLDAAEHASGADPNSPDTDGDGFRDVDDLTEGFTPVTFDEDLSGAPGWETEFLEGLLAGDFKAVDSLPQLAGSIAGNGAASLPWAGRYVGIAVGVRDAVANAVDRDASAAMMSAAAALSKGKRTAKVAGIVKRFVARNPARVRHGFEQLADWDLVPMSARVQIVKMIDQPDEKLLDELELSDAQVLALAARGIRLVQLVGYLDRGGEVIARGSSTDDTDVSIADAPQVLRAYVRGSGRTVPDEPVYIPVDLPGIPGGRLVDACVDCEAGPDPQISELHLANSGSQVWSRTLQGQVDKDALLRERGFAVTWHFFTGSSGLDLDPRLLDALDAADISYVAHLPA